MSDQPCSVPLIERLCRVPKDARLTYEVHSTEHHIFPIGIMCNEAAEHIKDLSLRIVVAVKVYAKSELDVSGYFIVNPAHAMEEVLTMPIESLHELIKNNPQYGEK